MRVLSFFLFFSLLSTQVISQFTIGVDNMITSCSGTLADSGQAAGDYSPGEDFTITAFTPA